MKEENKKRGNVPNLRFPEFGGEWIRYRISDVLDFFLTNSLSWDQLEYNGGNIYNLHYGLIHKNLPTQIDLNICTLPNIKEGFEPVNYTLCEDGDIVFADTSEDTNDVGKVVEFFSCADKKVVCGLHTIHGRDKKDLTIVGFKGYAFSSSTIRTQIKKLAQGTKIYSLSPKNFNESCIFLPSKEEQVKIARLLFLIDQRIETQNKIIEQYKSLIKGLTHFALNGKQANVRLKDCVACNSSTLTESEFEGIKGLHPVYGATGIIVYSPQYIVAEDSILVIKDGASVGRVQYVTGKYSVIGTLNYLTAKNDFSLRYI